MPNFKPNAYGAFVTEFRKIKAKEENITYASFNAASFDAAPLWEQMPQFEKIHYKLQANRKKCEETMSSNVKKTSSKLLKKTSQGRLLAEVHQQDKLLKNSVLQRQKYVEQLINKLHKSEALLPQVFYIMNSTSYIEDDKNYYHAEIAIAKFSLEKGVTDAIHLFIDHDNLPTGYVHDARERCEREHRIALPPSDNKILNPKIYLDAYYIVRDFLTTNADDGEFHLYAIEPQIKAIENFFKRCSESIGDEYIPQHYIIHDYVDLFASFLKKVINYDHNVLRSFITEQIEKDKHDMLRSLCCNYHFTEDALPHCSLSRAKRWAHYICEECCNKFGVCMVRGFHFPQEVTIVQKIVAVPRPTSTNQMAEEDANETQQNVAINASVLSQPSTSYEVPRTTPGQSQHGAANTTGRQSGNRAGTSANQNRPPPRRSTVRQPARQGPSGREGTTAGCTRTSRGGGNQTTRVSELNPPESSDDEDLTREIPHNDPAYLNILKSWDGALTADDVDPMVPIEASLQNLQLENGAAPNRNRFPKRKGNLAANFDNKMD